MRVLLPPSETKRKDGGKSVFEEGKLIFTKELGSARSAVKKTLEEISSDNEAASKALKLGKKSEAEIELNKNLDQQKVLPAIARYAGTLFDSINYKELDKGAQDWIGKNVLIQSALFGLIRATDEIPAYRVSADSKLKISISGDSAQTLKEIWRQAHSKLDLTCSSLGDPLILDLRSKNYANLAPLENAYYLNVVTKDSTGKMRALNHFNKLAKGTLVRKMAESNLEANKIDDILEWGKQSDFEFYCENKTLTLVTKMGVRTTPN